MSKREFIVILLAAIVLAVALPIVAHWFQPVEYVPESPIVSVRNACDSVQEAPPRALLATVNFRVVDSKTFAGLNVRMRVEVFDIAGRLVRETGNWFTDVEGRGSLKLEAGEWCRLHASTSLYEETWAFCPAVTSGAIINLGDVPMKALCHFEAKIVVNGKLHKSAIVKFVREGPNSLERELRTDANGWTSAYLPQGRWFASAQGQERTDWGVRETGLVCSTTFEVDSAEHAGPIYLGLIPGNASISGLIKDKNSNPVHRANLRLDRMGPGRPSVGICRSNTGVNGRFTFGGLAAGMYALTVCYPLSRGHAETTYAGIRLEEQTQLSDVEWSCPGPAAVEVRVTRRGLPFAGVRVVAFAEVMSTPDDGHNDPEAQTDHDGIARFKDIHLGEHTFHVIINARDRNQFSWSDITLDLKPDALLKLNIELEPEGSVELHGNATCNGKSIEPDDYLAGAGCYICVAGLGPCLGVFSQTKADGKGNYSISGLPRGRYVVSCFAVVHENGNRADHGPSTREIDLTAPDSGRLKVDLALLTRPVTIDARINGQSFDGSRHWLVLSPGPRIESWRFRGGTNGRLKGNSWLFEHLALGRHQMELATKTETGGWHVVATGTVEVNADSPEQISVNLVSEDLVKPGTICVAFEDTEFPPGSEPEHLRCRLFAEYGECIEPWGRVADSVRLFEELRPGKYTVRIDGPDIEPISSAVTLGAGQEFRWPVRLAFRKAHAQIELSGIGPLDSFLGTALFYLIGANGHVLPNLITAATKPDGSSFVLDLGWIPVSAKSLRIESSDTEPATVKLDLKTGVQAQLKLKLIRR